MLGNLVYDFIVELFGRHGDRSWTWIFDFIVGSKCITTRSSQHFSVSATTLSKPMSPPHFTPPHPTTIKSKKCPNNFQSFPVHLNVTNLSLAILSPQLKVPLQIQQNPDFIEGMRGQIGQVTKNVILPP